MTVPTLLDMMRMRPFAPFRVVTSEGEKHEILQPEMGWVVGDEMFIGIDESENGHPLDYRICSIPAIASIEPLEVTA